jgi:hypothetical protein
MPPMKVFLPIILDSDISGNIIAEVVTDASSNTDYDYYLSDSITENKFNIIDTSILSYLRYASSSDTTVFFTSQNSILNIAMRNSIDLLPEFSVFQLDPSNNKNLKWDTTNTSLIPNYKGTSKKLDQSGNDVTPTPGLGKLSDHYAAYLGSLFFNNPNTQAPFSNLMSFESQIKQGIMIDGSYNTLADQFMNIINRDPSGSEIYNNGTNSILSTIFYQLTQDTNRYITTSDVIDLNNIDRENELTDDNTQPFPFMDGDIITIDIRFTGNLSTFIPTRNMNFTYPTIGKLFQNRTDLSGNINPWPLTDTTNNIVVKTKKWRISFMVKDKQDYKKQPHLIVTQALNGLSVETLNNLFFDNSTGSYNLLQKIFNNNITSQIGSSGTRLPLALWSYLNPDTPKVLTKTNKNFLGNYDIDLASFNCMGYLELIYAEFLPTTNYYNKYITSDNGTDNSFFNIINSIKQDISNNISITSDKKDKLNNSFFNTLLILNSVKDGSGNIINSATLKTVKDTFYYLKTKISDSSKVNYTFHKPITSSRWNNNYISPFSYTEPTPAATPTEAGTFIDASLNLQTLMEQLEDYDVDTELLIENAMNEAKAIAKINNLTTYQDVSNNVFKLTEIIYETAMQIGAPDIILPPPPTINDSTNMLGGTINNDQATLTKNSSSYTAGVQFIKGYSQIKGKSTKSVKIANILDKLVRNARIFRDVILIASNHISLNDLKPRDLKTLVASQASFTFDPKVIKVDLIKNTIVTFMNQIIQGFGVLFNPNSSEEKKIGSLIIIFCTIIVSLAQIINSIMAPNSVVDNSNPEAELASLLLQIKIASKTPSWISEAIVMLNLCSFVCGDILEVIKAGGGEVDYTGYTYGCPNPVELGASATNIGNDIAALVSTTDPLKLFFKTLLVGSDVLDFVLLLMRGGNWNPLKWISGLITDELRDVGNLMLPYGIIFVNGYLEITSFIDNSNVVHFLIDEGDEFYNALVQHINVNPAKFAEIITKIPYVKAGFTSLERLFATRDAKYAYYATSNFFKNDIKNGFRKEIINPFKRTFKI